MRISDWSSDVCSSDLPDLAADQPPAAGIERTLAADEMVLVDPFPGALLEMLAHPGAVDEVHGDDAARAQRPHLRFEHGGVVLLAVEIAEGIAHQADAVEARLRNAELARVAFLEGDRQTLLLGTLAAEAHEVARTVDAVDVAEAAPRKLQAVPALAAAAAGPPAVRLRPAGPPQTGA